MKKRERWKLITAPQRDAASALWFVFPEVLQNAFKQAMESPEYKQVMIQLENEGRFKDSLTFTRLIQEVGLSGFPKALSG